MAVIGRWHHVSTESSGFSASYIAGKRQQAERDPEAPASIVFLRQDNAWLARNARKKGALGDLSGLAEVLEDAELGAVYRRAVQKAGLRLPEFESDPFPDPSGVMPFKSTERP